MKITKTEQRKMINIIADGLDDVAVLTGGGLNINKVENNVEAIADLIDDLRMLLQIINSAESIERTVLI